MKSGAGHEGRSERFAFMIIRYRYGLTNNGIPLTFLSKGPLAADCLLNLHDTRLDSINDVDKISISLAVLLNSRIADDVLQACHATASHYNDRYLTRVEEVLGSFLELAPDLFGRN